MRACLGFDISERKGKFFSWATEIFLFRTKFFEAPSTFIRELASVVEEKASLENTKKL